jgi:hypothetical protein
MKRLVPLAARHAPWLVTLALIAVTARLVDDKDLFMDYAKSLTWPVLTAGAVYYFRVPIYHKIGQMTQLTTPGGGTATFDPEVANDVLNAQLKSVSELQPPAPPAVDDNEEDAAQAQADTRRIIEEIITDSAVWGWKMAGMGFRNPPIPKIDWTNQGTPVIKYGMSDAQRMDMQQYDYHLLKDASMALTMARSRYGVEATVENLKALDEAEERLRLIEAQILRRDKVT